MLSMFAFSFPGVHVALPPAGGWRMAEVGGCRGDFEFA